VVCFLSGVSLFYFNNVHEQESASTIMNVILFLSFLFLNAIDLFGYAYLIYTITRKKIESSVSTRNKTINILTLLFIILYVLNKVILIVFFEVGTDSAAASPSKSRIAFVLFIIFIYVDYVILISFTAVKLYQYFDKRIGKTTTHEKSSGEKTTPKSNHNSKNDTHSKETDSKPSKSAEQSDEDEGPAIAIKTSEEDEIGNEKEKEKEEKEKEDEKEENEKDV